MPELPEVETIVRQLRPLLCRRVVLSQECLDPRLAVELAPLVSRTVGAVRRRGKEILLDFDGDPPRIVAVHLRMTGRLYFVPSEALPPSGRVRAKLRMNGGELWFVDTRRLGTLRVVDSEAKLATCGVDPLERELPLEVLTSLIGDSAQPIKPWLLRQDRLCGVGNIYASEVLFRAKIHPARAARSLSKKELWRLGLELRALLEQAVQACGTTFSDYADAHGEAGSFAVFLRVYGKPGSSCPRCGGVIERLVQVGRSTFFCSGCQR